MLAYDLSQLLGLFVCNPLIRLWIEVEQGTVFLAEPSNTVFFPFLTPIVRTGTVIRGLLLKHLRLHLSLDNRFLREWTDVFYAKCTVPAYDA